MNICYRYSYYGGIYITLLNVRFGYSMSRTLLSHALVDSGIWGDDEVLERTSYVHLGMECNKEMNVKTALYSLRQKFFKITLDCYILELTEKIYTLWHLRKYMK